MDEQMLRVPQPVPFQVSDAVFKPVGMDPDPDPLSRHHGDMAFTDHERDAPDRYGS